MKKVSTVILIICIMYMLNAYKTPNSVFVDEYDTSSHEWDFLEKNNVAYDIGANKELMPVFKDPDKAFKQAIVDYADGFKAIQKEYNLLPINRLNWKIYMTYGWQLTTDNENVRKQARAISGFLDIYENSFE